MDAILVNGTVGSGKSTVLDVLADILERTALDDLVLDSSAASPLELARAILRRVGWDANESPGS